jgi:hypothetical protein
MFGLSNFDLFIQGGLLLFTVIAQIMVNYRIKWAPVVALFGHGFWYYTAITNKQWGIVLNTLIFSLLYLHMAYLWIIKPSRTRA